MTASKSHKSPRSRGWLITAVVILATSILIVAGRFVAPVAIAMIWPDSPAPPAPARPASGSIHHLTDPDSVIRIETIESLARLNPGNPHVLKLIADVLIQDADASVRLEAAQALSRSQQDPIVLPPLTTALADSDAMVRRQAVIAIGKFGADATSVLSALEELSNRDKEDSETRELASEVMQTIQATNPSLTEP